MGALDDEIAIAAGSGRGIGREIALGLACRGTRAVKNSEPAKG